MWVRLPPRASPAPLLIAALAAVAALAPAASAAAAWRPDVAAARRFAATRPGSVAVSVRTPCGVWGFGQDRRMPAASLLKPLLLLSHLHRPQVRSRRLRAADRARLGPMIRRSANEPANALVGELGAAQLQRDARRWGLTGFRLLDPWGLSPVTARSQARLWLHLERRLPRRHRAFALRLFEHVVPAQRWGIAQAAPRGWRLRFKGGWGSGTGWVDHQAAQLTAPGGRRVAVALLTRDQGTHAQGQATLEGLARRLLRGLGRTRRHC